MPGRLRERTGPGIYNMESGGWIMRKQMTGKMALGAGLAFLMAVSLTGCEMDRMDQEAAETKAEDPADETETAESGDNRTGEIPEETSRGIGAGPGARSAAVCGDPEEL